MEGALSLSRECKCHAPIWLAKQLQVSRGDSREREEIQVGSQPIKCLRHSFQSNPRGVIGSDPAVPRNDCLASKMTQGPLTSAPRACGIPQLALLLKPKDRNLLKVSGTAIQREGKI